MNRRLTWSRTAIGRETSPNDFSGAFAGITVARISRVPNGPRTGDWQWSMTHPGSGLFGFNEKHVLAGVTADKQAAADECTRLFFLLYDEFRLADRDWRNPRNRRARFSI